MPTDGNSKKRKSFDKVNDPLKIKVADKDIARN